MRSRLGILGPSPGPLNSGLHRRGRGALLGRLGAIVAYGTQGIRAAALGDWGFEGFRDVRTRREEGSV